MRKKGKAQITMWTPLQNHHLSPIQGEALPVRESRLIELHGVTKAYDGAAGKFMALKGIDMQVDAGEFVAVVGKSGSGKSTLINMITGIDHPTAGEVFVASTPVHALNQEQLAVWRGKNVGIVFQFFQLLPTLTVAENVVLPMDFCNVYSVRERRDRAMSLLEKVGIPEQADKLPSDLSGGQQQRAAIARALANDPPLIVADEPTGNLDSQTSEAVMQLFADLAVDGKTVVMVTHERDLSRYFTRAILLSDGAVVTDPGGQNE
ncbi:MAG TPA: ABC transporter ATP-binding protein [Anaerolineales bacterium]|nr:ABC transporter ATP-binding protein [Anaerolineales bacterium]